MDSRPHGAGSLPLHRSSAGCAGGRFRRPSLPTQALSQQSLEHSTYQKKPRAMEGAGRLGVSTRGGGEQSLGRRLCQQGVAHTALKRSAGGGLGKGSPLPLQTPSPVRQSPARAARGAEGERTEASIGSYWRGCPSVIRDALGSQLLLHPGQVGGVRVPKPGSKEK